MKRFMKRFAFIVLPALLCVLLVAGASSGRREGRNRLFSCLTEEQRDAVQAKIEEMRTKGAEPEEIHGAVKEMLEGYGVRVPDHSGRRGPKRAVFSQLSEDQRSAVREKMREMRDAGADHKEIHEELTRMLKSYGVDAPEKTGRLAHPRALFGKLTADQRQALQKKIKEMRDAGASREEIRSAVSEMLKGYGVELPPRSGPASGLRKRAGQRIQAQSYPNPAHSEANISYAVSARSRVRVRIYNTAGQLVRTYDMKEQGPGSHNVHWDGRHEDGRKASSGMYIYRIDAGDDAVVNSLVLLN